MNRYKSLQEQFAEAQAAGDEEATIQVLIKELTESWLALGAMPNQLQIISEGHQPTSSLGLGGLRERGLIEHVDGRWAITKRGRRVVTKIY